MTDQLTPPDDPHVDDAPRPRGHSARYAALAVGVVLLLFIGLLATRRPAADQTTANPLLGQRIPELTGQTLDGKQITVDTFRGKWVVVNFLASWCIGCRDEHPELLAFQREHPDDVQIIGVAFNDNPDALRAFFAENGGNWPVIMSDDGRAAIDFGVTAVPESFVVRPDQLVVAHAEGVTRDWLDGVIAEVNAANPPSPVNPQSGAK